MLFWLPALELPPALELDSCCIPRPVRWLCSSMAARARCSIMAVSRATPVGSRPVAARCWAAPAADRTWCSSSARAALALGLVVGEWRDRGTAALLLLVVLPLLPLRPGEAAPSGPSSSSLPWPSSSSSSPPLLMPLRLRRGLCLVLLFLGDGVVAAAVSLPA